LKIDDLIGEAETKADALIAACAKVASTAAEDSVSKAAMGAAELGAVMVGAEVCAAGIRLRWESRDGRDGGEQLLTEAQTRHFYEALRAVLEKAT
jgi:hypothetical protein